MIAIEQSRSKSFITQAFAFHCGVFKETISEWKSVRDKRNYILEQFNETREMMHADEATAISRGLRYLKRAEEYAFNRVIYLRDRLGIEYPEYSDDMISLFSDLWLVSVSSVFPDGKFSQALAEMYDDIENSKSTTAIFLLGRLHKRIIHLNALSEESQYVVRHPGEHEFRQRYINSKKSKLEKSIKNTVRFFIRRAPEYLDALVAIDGNNELVVDTLPRM